MVRRNKLRSELSFIMVNPIALPFFLRLALKVYDPLYSLGYQNYPSS